MNKLSSLDKSRSSSRTETLDTIKPLNKTRSISPASLDDKDIKKKQPKEIKFRNDKLRSDTTSVSSMSVNEINSIRYYCLATHWTSRGY